MLIGSAQWAVTLGQYDVQYATNTTEKFSQQPRKVHINRACRIFICINFHILATIHIDPQQINTEVIYFIYNN